MGAGYHGGFGNTEGSENKNERGADNRSNHESKSDLIAELRKNKVKFFEKDIVFIVRENSGKIVWLESGDMSAGLKHILDGANKGRGHAKDFYNAFGIPREKISSFLKDVFIKGKILKETLVNRNGRDGFERIYKYKGKYLLISAVGTNGFIVSAYPIKEEDL